MRAMGILRTALIGGGVFAAAVLVVGAIVGWFVAGASGLVSGVLGAVLAAVFTGLTTFSFWLGMRLQGGEQRPGMFYGLVLGTFAVKIVVFLVGLIWLSGQPWLSPAVFAVTSIVAVVGSLVVDALAFARGQGAAAPARPGATG